MRNANEQYAPVYYVKVGGSRLPDELAQRVLGIEYEDDAEKLPKLAIRFDNSDLEITDHPLFALGKEVQVQFGYIDGDLTRQKTFTVKAIQGFKVRTLIAYGGGHALSAKGRTRCWENVRYSDIARNIAADHGLRAVVDDSEIAHEQVNQAGQTDLNFLKQLGSEIGYECYVEGDELHFHPKRYDAAPVLALAYYNGEYGNLISFEPTEKTLAEPTEVAAAGVDPFEKSAFVAKADEVNVERTMLAEGSYMYEASMGIESFRPGETGKWAAAPAESQSHAKQVADAKFKEAESETVEATINTVGETRLEAKRVVTLYGLGKRYSGNWYVANVRHVLGQGYKCIAKLERNAAGGTSQATGAKPASGVVNKNKANLQDEKRLAYQYSAQTGAEREIQR